MPWLLDPFCFMSACPCCICVAVCSVIASYVLLVGASVADAAVPVGDPPFAAGLVPCCMQPLSLPPSSHVAGRCPPSFRPFGGAEAAALLGLGVLPICLFFQLANYILERDIFSSHIFHVCESGKTDGDVFSQCMKMKHNVGSQNALPKSLMIRMICTQQISMHCGVIKSIYISSCPEAALQVNLQLQICTARGADCVCSQSLRPDVSTGPQVSQPQSATLSYWLHTTLI
jgi:hypothetical protein